MKKRLRKNWIVFLNYDYIRKPGKLGYKKVSVKEIAKYLHFWKKASPLYFVINLQNGEKLFKYFGRSFAVNRKNKELTLIDSGVYYKNCLKEMYKTGFIKLKDIVINSNVIKSIEIINEERWKKENEN